MLTQNDINKWVEENPETLLYFDFFEGCKPVEVKIWDIFVDDLESFQTEDFTPLRDVILKWKESKKYAPKKSVEQILNEKELTSLEWEEVPEDKKQEWINNKQNHSFDKEVEGWAFDEYDSECANQPGQVHQVDLLSIERRAKHNYPFIVKTDDGRGSAFENFSLTNPNEPAKPKYKPFEKLTEEQILYFVGMKIQGENSERISLIEAAHPYALICEGGEIPLIDAFSKGLKYHNGKEWVPFGIEVSE